MSAIALEIPLTLVTFASVARDMYDVRMINRL
jgi:hypothetical protein